MTEKFHLYNGTVELCYDPQRHLYTVGGIPIEGVTSVVSVIDKSAPLMQWAVNEAIDYLRERIKPGLPLDEIQLKEALYGASIQHKVFKRKAGDLGTLIHGWIESYIKGEKPPMPINEAMKNGVNAFLSWMEKNEVKFLSSERKIYSRKYKFAGTLDAEGTIGGKSAIIDFKTSNAIYDEMRYQVAAYQCAREEEEGKRYDERWIIRFSKKLDDAGLAEFEAARLDNYEEDLKAFLGALVLYRRQKQLRGMFAPLRTKIESE